MRGSIIAKCMAILSVLLLLLVIELLLRVYHQRAERQALPTELRMETRALTWDDIKDKYRIVCFGDSITFGEDLPSTQAYPAVLAELLKQKHADLDLVVINAGVRGHTSVQGLARLERDVLRYKPHVVLIAFGLNDGKLGYWPLDPIRERAMYDELGLKGRLTALLRHSHLWLTLQARSKRLLRKLGWHGRVVEVDFHGEPQPRVSPQGFEIALERLAIRIRAGGCVALFWMTTTPVTEAFNSELGLARHKQLVIYEEYNRIVRDIAAKHGGYLIDLYAIFTRRMQQIDLLVTVDGVHLTPAGERLIAISVLQALEEAGLPGSEPYIHARQISPAYMPEVYTRSDGIDYVSHGGAE